MTDRAIEWLIAASYANPDEAKTGMCASIIAILEAAEKMRAFFERWHTPDDNENCQGCMAVAEYDAARAAHTEDLPTPRLRQAGKP